MTKNNKNLLIVFAAFIVFAAQNVYAGCDGFYMAARAGISKFKVDDSRHGVNSNLSNYVVDKKRFIAGGALGYRYKHFRTELEYIWNRKHTETIINITRASFRSESYMFVVYYDFFPYSWFTPFVDAGIGYSRHRLSFLNKVANVKYSAKDNNLTWSLGAGISAQITNRVNLDVGYRYYDMGSLSEHSGKTDVTNQEVYMGIRYVF